VNDHPPQFSRTVPEGDNVERSVCDRCGFIDYQNPRIVVGSIATWNDQILLCRRAIEPGYGYWTFPGGFMELKESPEQAAAREADEEANVELAVGKLMATYFLSRVGQVQLIYQAKLVRPQFSPGPESLDVALFDADKLPWDELAFPTVKWALTHHLEIRSEEHFTVRTNPEGQTGDMRRHD